MKKKNILSVMMAVSLVFLQVMTAMFSFPMHVSAGEMLGENDFDSGKGLPWHICESATAKMEFAPCMDDRIYRGHTFRSGRKD